MVILLGYLIDDKTFINENIFKYEERMNSQYSRFLDKNPTFVTYYNIDNINSITDSGFINIEDLLGENSPLKFKKINDFPVYGLESIMLELSEEEEGLTTNFDSELIILPNTLKPLPNDFFTISYLDKNYLFMVTEVKYDTIKSNNYYKISFTLKSAYGELVTDLNNQINEIYNCVLRNIGTQEKCLIREDDYYKILKLNEIYRYIADKYKIFFFNKKYNCFMFNNELGSKFYDKYLNYFINNNILFNEKYNFNTICLVNEDDSSTFVIEYEKSIYRFLEKNKKNLPLSIKYSNTIIKNHNSIFLYFLDNVNSIVFSTDGIEYIEDNILNAILTDIKLSDEFIIENLMVDYFNKHIDSIYNINLEQLEEYEFIEYSFNSFIKIPILLFILRFYYNKFVSNN